MTKKANHQANIVRITEIKEHTNADTLVIVPVGEYQVVSKKDQFKVGDLGVYIQPDSVVPQTEPFKFIWQPYLDDLQNNPVTCKHVDDEGKSTIYYTGEEYAWGYKHSICQSCMLTNPWLVPEKKRRITVRKFRKEWSEGLLLPISDFNWDHPNAELLTEGLDVSDILGITHYDPDTESTKGENTNAPKVRKKYPRSLRGWYNYIVRRIRNFFRIGPNTDGSSDNISLGIPTYDVNSFKNHSNVFQEGEQVVVTEKIHGSNARYIYLDGKMYAGSRNLWKSENSNCIFRRALKELPWIEEWCRAHEGYVLWGEVTPTQTGYEYGSKSVQFFVFDVYTPEGKWVEFGDYDTLAITPKIQVPILYWGPYNLEKIKSLVDGPSTVPGAKNIREGVVVKSIIERHLHGVGRAQLKIVSNTFLEKEQNETVRNGLIL